MPAITIPEAREGLEPEQSTVRNLLIENGQLIEAAAEYQRMGRIEESIKYQELLHKNLIYIAKLADPFYASQILQEIGASSTNGENVSQMVEKPATADIPAPQLQHQQQPQLQQHLLIPSTNGPIQQQHLSPNQLQQASALPPHIVQQRPIMAYGTTQAMPHQQQQMIYGYPGQQYGPPGYMPSQSYPQQHSQQLNASPANNNQHDKVDPNLQHHFHGAYQQQQHMANKQ